MKRPRLRTCVLLGVLGALLALTGAAYLVSQREVVTVAAFYERLTVGMTEAEVAAAVPIPPGDYTGGYMHTTSRPTCEGGLPIYIDYCTRADGTVSAPHPLTGRPIRGKWWRGKDGLVIKPGNAEKSEMVRRTSLPREDDDHMPPKEKPQLSQDQIALIHWWIATGASFSKKVKDLDQPENIKPILVALQKEEQKKIPIPDIPATPVPKADEIAIKKLRDIGVVVIPVAQNTNYLLADLVTMRKFGDSDAHLLEPLKEQLIWLKMGSTLITDSSLQLISQFRNLMRLQLDHTNVTDRGLASLRSLTNLRYLNLVGTRVTAQGIMQLKNLRNLQSIYLYQTEVKKSDWHNLKKMFPKTLIDSGGYTVPFLPTDTIEVKPPKTTKIR